MMDGDPGNSWHEAAESFLETVSKSDEKVRREILSILREIPGLS